MSIFNKAVETFLNESYLSNVSFEKKDLHLYLLTPLASVSERS